jgi:hypothetical protein
MIELALRKILDAVIFPKPRACMRGAGWASFPSTFLRIQASALPERRLKAPPWLKARRHTGNAEHRTRGVTSSRPF